MSCVESNPALSADASLPCSRSSAKSDNCTRHDDEGPPAPALPHGRSPLTTTLVAAASVLGTLVVVLLVLLARGREPAAAPAPVDAPVVADADALARDLRLALERYRSAPEPSRAEPTHTEAPPVAGNRVEQLEDVLARMLRAAGRIPGADAALALVVGLGRPVVATVGLSNEEAKRLVSTLPVVGDRTRALAISYDYGDAEAPAGPRIERGLGVAIPNVPAPALLVVVSRAPAATLGEPQIEMLEEVARQGSPSIAALLDARAAGSVEPAVFRVEEASDRAAPLADGEERQDRGQIDRLRQR